MFYYSIFGLNFFSEIELPMLNAMAKPSNIDVTIQLGNTPETLENPTDERVTYQAKEGEFLMYFKFNPVRFYIKNGNSITIETGDSEDWDFVRLFLLAPVVGALLHQRRVIPLHAGGVVIEGEAVLFSGHSGAGKSTTTAAFKEKGYQLMADDVAVIHNNEMGSPIVEPGVPFVKLWKESFEVLEKEVPTEGRIREKIEKYFVPIEDIAPSALPIKRIYILEKSNLVTEPQIKNLSSIETVHQLRLGTYRYYFLIGLGGENEHFKMAFNLGSRGMVKHLIRPEVYPVDKLIEFIEADLKA
jgi:hypothetical protein